MHLSERLYRQTDKVAIPNVGNKARDMEEAENDGDLGVYYLPTLFAVGDG